MQFTRAAGDRELRIPHPFGAARSFLVLSLIPLLAGVVGLIPELDGLVLGALIAGAGLVRAALEYRQLSSLRGQADRQLLGTLAPRSPRLVAWRAGELTSERNRRQLAGSLRGVVSELDPHRLPGPSPLNRPGVRPHADLIMALSHRVADTEQPVSARGILLTEELLTDGSGPLYARERVDELGPLLRRCLRVLDAARSSADRMPASAATHVELHAARNGRR